MTPRLFAIAFLAAGLAACIPKQSDPNMSDLDGDGVPDAIDQCMADPEDFDGFEDEDGCSEAEGPAATSNTTDAIPEITTKRKPIRKSGAKALSNRKVQATTKKYQSKAWGATIDSGERSAVVFGFGKAWITSKGNSTQLKGDAYLASFSPNGEHVAIVGIREFLIIKSATGKIVQRLPYAKGTIDATETKLIRIHDDGTILFFDGCQLRKGKVGKKASSALSPKHCGDRPLASKDGSRWLARQDEDDGHVAIFALDVESGERRPVLGGVGDAPGLGFVALSPGGRQLCYSRHKDGSELTCRNLQSSKDLLLWKGPTDRRAAFAADGTLGFGAGAKRTQRDFYQADLKERTLRKLGTLGPREEWINAVGAHGFIASGGARLREFDLDAGEQLDITLGKGEWEGFAAIPGAPHEFIVGKERGATRDLFRVSAH